MGWVFEISNRKNKNAALFEAENILKKLEIELDNKLKAILISKFWRSYELTRNKILVKEKSIATVQAKIDFIDWVKTQLDLSIYDLEQFKDKNKVEEKVKDLGSCFGILMSILNFGITSRFLIQWKYDGESFDLINEILIKFEEIMRLLHQLDPKITLLKFSERINEIIKTKKVKKGDHNLAKEILIRVATELATKG